LLLLQMGNKLSLTDHCINTLPSSVLSAVSSGTIKAIALKKRSLKVRIMQQEDKLRLQ
jgi:hypothetical protein